MIDSSFLFIFFLLILESNSGLASIYIVFNFYLRVGVNITESNMVDLGCLFACFIFYSYFLTHIEFYFHILDIYIFLNNNWKILCIYMIL